MDIWYFYKEQPPVKVTEITGLDSEGFIWIDAQPPETINTINLSNQLTHTTLNDRHVKDCLNLQHPCFYDSTQLYDILIFRSLVAEDQDNIDTAPIAFILYPNLLVSFNNNDTAIKRVKQRFEDAHKRIPSDPASLLQLILNKVIDSFLELKTPLFNKFNGWEQKLLDNSEQFNDWLDLLHFKAEVRKLRILSEEQQDVVYQWRHDLEISLSEQLSVRFNDLSEHIRRILRYSLQLENEIESLIQLHYSKIGNRTNEIMRLLTVISAIFLPLNLIAAILSMNFQHSLLLAHPHGPEMSLIGMLIIGVLMFFFFKWKDWI